MDQSIQILADDEHGEGGRDLRRVGIDPNHWYPAAWSRELKAGATYAARFAGDPIVLVRPKDPANPVFALEDRCAHRQVPLSDGAVEGCAVRCGYHGWAYDMSGRCTDVPYLGKGKLPNGVRAYPCREVDGLIFVFPGDPALAAQVPIPRLARAADDAYKTRRLGKRIKCHYSFMHENLMDMNHQFLHRKQMGNIRPRFLGGDGGGELGRGALQLRPHRRQAILGRGRDLRPAPRGQRRQRASRGHDDPHRLPLPEPRHPHAGRHHDHGTLDRLRSHRSRAARLPHLRSSLRPAPQARHPARRRLAGPGLVHRPDLPGKTRTSSSRNRRRTTPRATIGTRRSFP